MTTKQVQQVQVQQVQVQQVQVQQEPLPFRVRIRQKISRDKKKEFLTKNNAKYLLTTRFSNETWNENMEYIQKQRQIKCIYCNTYGVSETIPVNKMIYVLEMNNNTNQIMGVGLVRNSPYREYFRVYKKGLYNMTAYVGYHRLCREELCNDIIDDVNILEELEHTCFKGKGHLKMGQGMTSFPIHVLVHLLENDIDVLEWLSKKFKEKYVVSNSNKSGT